MAKGTPIHVHLLDSPDVKRFAEVAEKVCDVFERVDDLSEIEFLQQIEERLPLAYSLAHRLPDPYNWEEDDDDEPYEPRPEIELPHGGQLEWWKHLRDVVGKELSWHRLFHFVYDPVSPNDREVINADLADCLADIYIDLKIGLIHYDEGTIEHQAEAVWLWKFGINAWGTRAAEVILPIHHLLHSHYDEDDEVFRYD